MTIKHALGSLAASIIGRPVLHALPAAEKAEIISFDVFDTLILRRCKPHEVFSIAEEKYNSCHDDHAAFFRKQRINAERSVRRKSMHEEITLDEIYDELSDIYSKDFLDDMKNFELEAEFEAVFQNAELKNFYDTLRQNGNRIIITSDMYLSAYVIERMLQQCGYSGYETLYVSSEFRARKKNGKLFRRVIEDKGVSAQKILHIGDNVLSDWLMAKCEGLKSFLYKK